MIYFVSDIHLGCVDAEQSKRAERAFCRWLDMVAKDAEAIYLLGDIFDFWFEYHKVAPRGFVRVLGRLAELSDRGVQIVFYPGNHDMWCLDYLTKECGVRIEHKPRVELIGERKIHLAHGDNMNIKGQPMLKVMNGLFRSKVARFLFRWLIHPDLSAYLGAKLSGKSRKAHSKTEAPKDKSATPPLRLLDPLIEYAEMHRISNPDVSAYIFGHMHISHSSPTQGMEVFFLSDWSREEATYAAMDGNGIELKNFKIDETIS